MIFDFFPNENQKIKNSDNFHYLKKHKFDNDIDSDTETIKNAIWKNYKILSDVISKNQIW